MRRKWIAFFSLLLLVVKPVAAGQAESGKAKEPRIPRIAAADARQYVGKRCVVEMTVRAGRLLPGPGFCFLNSHKNYRDSANFTAVIDQTALTALKKQKINNPARFYHGKKIRVTGQIVLYNKRPQIMVEKTAQIKIVKQPKKRAEKNGSEDRP